MLAPSRPSIYGDDALAWALARARVGAPMRCLLRSVRYVSGHRIRSFTSTVATPRDVPGIGQAMRDWYGTGARRSVPSSRFVGRRFAQAALARS